MSFRPRPPSFADACARVIADPDADHSLTTTLAPVQARIAISPEQMAKTDAWGDLLGARLPADVERVLELGCGTGTLLHRLSDEYTALGIDRYSDLLSFAAARGEAAVCGDPTDPPVRPDFDAVCAFDHFVARQSLSAVCEGAYATLRPGGIFVFDALSDARAIAASGVETYRGARYVFERSVDVARNPPVVHVDYRVTDLRTGETGVTAERTSFNVYDPESVRESLETAGFSDIRVVTDAGDDGEFLVTAVRPVETEA
ncbi:class I SAM-dependent methyltransferase [Halogeometricum borinquense]|uniref:Class I SAM-dependent methyltransferase n=1 Tax=Halogeometricum borinquense TaxID=60847 RepID=A0A482TCT7_9EURY|nr:class I SAM-dependent methyltransferase [Halogeometricum borinquense]RYJ14562.1 class I SAM-dependent methyltransferase [Halogeometricum borinquense]